MKSIASAGSASASSQLFPTSSTIHALPADHERRFGPELRAHQLERLLEGGLVLGAGEVDVGGGRVLGKRLGIDRRDAGSRRRVHGALHYGLGGRESLTRGYRRLL